MAWHKRRRPKNRRSGCLLCKRHKANGAKERVKRKYRPLREDAEYA